MELIAVVMGAETSADRFAACKSMLDYGFANYGVFTPQLPENPVVPVRLGKETQVTAQMAEADGILVDKGQKGQITTRMTLEPEVTAPVSAGQRLGTLEILSGEQVIAQIPLLAKDAVNRLSWRDLFLKFMRKLVMSD